jgi:hypothetical protein
MGMIVVPGGVGAGAPGLGCENSFFKLADFKRITDEPLLQVSSVLQSVRAHDISSRMGTLICALITQSSTTKVAIRLRVL